MTHKWGAPLVATATGIATFAILIAFGLLPEVKAAYPHGDFSAALGAFQRANTMDELYRLFGNPPDAGKLAAMTAGNTLDLYGFIPVYTIFLLSSALTLGEARGLAWFALIAALVGCAGDLLETISQLGVSTDWAHASAILPRVSPGCWTKFFGLAVHALGCSALCFTGPHKRWILGALGLTPIVATSADFLHFASAATAMTLVFGLFWLGLLIVACGKLVAAMRTASAQPG
jgi:hypothetical protein